MKPTENLSPTETHVGYFKNGVVVLDTSARLREGQAVRIEPIGDKMEANADTDRADRVRRLQQLFTEWTEEDGKLSDEETDRLHAALEQSRGLNFRSPAVD